MWFIMFINIIIVLNYFSVVCIGYLGELPQPIYKVSRYNTTTYISKVSRFTPQPLKTYRIQYIIVTLIFISHIHTYLPPPTRSLFR